MRLCIDCKENEKKWSTSLYYEKCTNKHCENYIEPIIIVRKKIIKKPNKLPIIRPQIGIALKQMSITFYYNQNIATA
jgi:hypothetical protein